MQKIRTVILTLCGVAFASCGAPRPAADQTHESVQTDPAEALIEVPNIDQAAEPENPVEVSQADTSAPVLSSATPLDRLDPALIGVWINEDNLNSGGGAGGFASLSTVMTMQLSAEGRVVQSTMSAGGGGDWSYDGGETIDFDGEWRAGDGILYVKGMGLTEFTPAARYEFSGAYLVTHNDQGRLIWQRQQ